MNLPAPKNGVWGGGRERKKEKRRKKNLKRREGRGEATLMILIS